MTMSRSSLLFAHGKITSDKFLKQILGISLQPARTISSLISNICCALCLLVTPLTAVAEPDGSFANDNTQSIIPGINDEDLNEFFEEYDLNSFGFLSFNYIDPEREIDFPEISYIEPINVEPVPHVDLDSLPSIWPRVIASFGMAEINNKRVRQYERWYRSNPDYLARMFDRSQRFIHLILSEVEKRDMPSELALLPMIESAYNPTAYSRAHAAGLWQFIPSTGKNYGLEQSWWADERRDVIQATRAALDYLENLYDDFGDWHLALAAYNYGENGLKRAIKRNKKRKRSTKYTSLRLPKETKNYVPKLQAIKNIVLNPTINGDSLPHVADFAYAVPVTLTDLLDIELAAKFADLSIEEFEQLNPSHNRPVITSNGQQTILIPYDKVDLFTSNLMKHDGPKLSWGTYEFVKGDTLSSVAKKFNINTQRLMEINGLKPYVPILSGQSILIPWTADGPSNLTETWQLPEFSQPSSLYGKEIIYKIKRGDTLSGISKRFGVSIKAIKTWNRIKGTMIREGKKLVIYKDFKSLRVSKRLER